MDNEVSIKLKLDTSEVTAPQPGGAAATGVPVQTKAPIANARAERASMAALMAQQRASDFEKLENRLFRRLSKFGIRAGAGLALAGVSELTLGDSFFSRMGSSVAYGAAFGGYVGAAVAVSMQTIGEVTSKLKDHWEAIMQIKKTTLALQAKADELKSAGERRIMELDAKFAEKLAEEIAKMTEERDELIYQTGQYVED